MKHTGTSITGRKRILDVLMMIRTLVEVDAFYGKLERCTLSNAQNAVQQALKDEQDNDIENQSADS